MNKKKIIQIIVILGAFAGSAAVLYNGFFNNSSSAPVVVNKNALPSSAAVPAGLANGAAMIPGGSSAISSEKLLPFGEKLDFAQVLDGHHLRFGATNYAQLDPSSEVGVPVEQLIKPQPKSK